MTDWARNCTCGHGEAEHRSNGSKTLNGPKRGICLIAGCRCETYTWANNPKRETSAAA